MNPGKVSTSQPVLLEKSTPKPESDTQLVNFVMTKEPESTSRELNGVSKLEIEQEEDPLEYFLSPVQTIKCSEEPLSPNIFSF